MYKLVIRMLMRARPATQVNISGSMAHVSTHQIVPEPLPKVDSIPRNGSVSCWARETGVYPTARRAHRIYVRSSVSLVIMTRSSAPQSSASQTLSAHETPQHGESSRGGYRVHCRTIPCSRGLRDPQWVYAARVNCPGLLGVIGRTHRHCFDRSAWVILSTACSRGSCRS
ncbi:hypothetical protein QR46_4634 [Giardia duodenalis assemblage B]|uniref:Uncharacterized protein n=1 Tax=Giardia duodenalis assemblage B TaxID=1394984 RepID=A0A132NMY7_GIAIN|nr:hypothetical protein QR46_4634 [Giardia intestinalis assemblage B]